MKKTYIILAVIIISALFLFSLYLALTSKKQVSVTQNKITGPTLSVPASGGGSVQVSDVTKSPQQIVGDTNVVEQNNNYSIVYFTADQSFLITILAEPAQASRDAAEQEFLNKLKIQEPDACRLKVALTVPAGVDEQLAGKDYGLSFCPTGQSF